MPDSIENCIASSNWEAARKLILAELDKEPEDTHWLLTRLGLTYYEQFDYRKALELSKQAFALVPECPLVIWDYAGTLEMLDRYQEALAMYQRIVIRSIESLAYDRCGEGRARARGIYSDRLYRMSHCCTALGEREKAIALMQQCLQMRGAGCQSIYPIKTVRKELQSLLAELPAADRTS